MFKKITCFLIITAILLTTLLCACGEKEPVSGPELSKEMSELGDDFATDLQREILPHRENTQNLTEYGYVLKEYDNTYNIDELTEFFTAYQGGNDDEITIVFAGSAFVAARLVFLNDNGYYLRYEYDKSRPEELAISCRLFDSIDLNDYSSETGTKWVLKILSGKKEIAAFELKNPSK